MITLALDRSTDTQSAAIAKDGKVVASKVFPHSDSRSADWPIKVREFLAANNISISEVNEFLVGQGPGSFSGIRAALAFAQGLALPAGKKVTGLPSAMALTRDGAKMAVVGDARRGLYWVVLYDGVRVVRDFNLVAMDALAASVPDEYSVVTPDGARINQLLESIFQTRYIGSAVPMASRLAEVAIMSPTLPIPEPLPIYLSAPVR